MLCLQGEPSDILTVTILFLDSIQTSQYEKTSYKGCQKGNNLKFQ